MRESLEQPVWPWEDAHVCTSLTHASKGEVEALPFQACNVCEATCDPGGPSDRGPAVRLWTLGCSGRHQEQALQDACALKYC